MPSWKSRCVPRYSGRWGRQRLASLDHPSVNQFVGANRATIMRHQRLRFVGVTRFQRLFELPIHLEDEVALEEATAGNCCLACCRCAIARDQAPSKALKTSCRRPCCNRAPSTARRRERSSLKWLKPRDTKSAHGARQNLIRTSINCARITMSMQSAHNSTACKHFHSEVPANALPALPSRAYRR